MNKYDLVNIIENFAPQDTQEAWDCSGWIVDEKEILDIKKVMLALTITDEIVKQAKENNCDMIISHHPLFQVPLNYKNIQMYCAHTNLDKAPNGTTDTLIKSLELNIKNIEISEFTRYVELKEEITLSILLEKIKKISKNARYTNNKNLKHIKKIALCAGSGSEFIKDAENKNFDVFITGDLKYHTAVDTNMIVIDIGHFESEILVLKTLYDKLKDKMELIYAQEKSPFNYI